MSSLGQIEVLLSGAWRGKGFRHFLELLRSLSSRIEMVLTMLDQNTVIRKRRQDPETWFFFGSLRLIRDPHGRRGARYCRSVASKTSSLKTVSSSGESATIGSTAAEPDNGHQQCRPRGMRTRSRGQKG
jgi:hypothetical protein